MVRLLNGRGQKARAKYASVPRLAAIEQRFGVPGGVLVAFWGMESDYGANVGDRDVLRATATHGAAASGGADWSAEFIAALKILQTGVLPRARLVGSYAGALGQTQLMPTNYLNTAWISTATAASTCGRPASTCGRPRWTPWPAPPST